MTLVIPLAEPLLPPECADAVGEVVRSTFIGPGKRTSAFEDSLAALCGTEAAVATVSGTVALGVAARALGLTPGDTVLIPAYGVISVPNGFAAEGFHVRPVDVDLATAVMDTSALDAALDSVSGRCAVCMVDFSGYVGPALEEIRSVAHRRGVPVIEDAACALGSVAGSLRAGSLGDVATTSFSVPKVVTTGQGGAILGSNSVVDRARAWVDQGDLEWRSTGLNRGVGTNLRFTDLQAALGQPQVDALAQRLDRRLGVHEALRSILGPALWGVPGGTPPLHNIIFAEDAASLVAALRSDNILAVRQYQTLGRHSAYADVAAGSFPVSDWWSDHAVFLPFGTALDVADAIRIAEAVRSAGGVMDAPPREGVSG